MKLSALPYAGKVFAARGGNIASTKDNITELVEEVKSKGVDSPDLLVGSIPRKGVVYIL